MRLTSERSNGVHKWSVETTGAVDRALAGLLTVASLAVAQVIGLPGALLHLVVRVL